MRQQDELVFSITLEDLQHEAIEMMGRTLTEEEVEIAKDGLYEGLRFDIDTVYRAIFFEMITR
ncbi:MAG: hypothetical protein HYX80_01115 [Chloroflexi bacterium]|nr:hypothetical protein [Chloroflexota bacterium]